MIIKYSTHDDTFRTCLRLPDSLPWKLMVELTDFDEAAAEAGEEEYICSYAVKLIAGAMEEIIIESEYYSKPEHTKIENWDDEIRDFFNYIVDEATSALAYAERCGEQVFDLGDTISMCREEWYHQLQLADKDSENSTE